MDEKLINGKKKSRRSAANNDDNNHRPPHRRDTVGLDDLPLSAREGGGARAQQVVPVCSKRVVEACELLKISLTRRLDKPYIHARFDEARRNLATVIAGAGADATTRMTTASDANFVNSQGSAPGGAFGNITGGGGARASTQQHQQYNAISSSGTTATRTPHGSGLNSNPNLGRASGRSATASSSATPAAILLAKSMNLEALQKARNILIENASPSKTKTFFGELPDEWLDIFGAIAKIILFIGLTCLVPCVSLQLDCTELECQFNPASVANNGTRDWYLRSVMIADCPFQNWTQAIFGVWFIIVAAGIFAGLFFVWGLMDTVFRPFAARVPESLQTIAATLSTVPLRTRIFFVLPPLFGLGLTGALVWSRLHTPPDQIRWSWGLIVAPAIVGYGFALFLRLYVAWQYMDSGGGGGGGGDGAGGGAATSMPSSWAKVLLAVDAISMTVAAIVSPSILAKNADCDGYLNWSAVVIPIFIFLGVSATTMILELVFRATQQDQSELWHSEFSMDEDKPRPLWQDTIRLITRQAAMIAGFAILYVKLNWPHLHEQLKWRYVLLPFTCYCAIAFFTSCVELHVAIRKAKEQYRDLNKEMTPQEIEESLIDMNYGALTGET